MGKLFKKFEDLDKKYYEDAKRNIEELSNINDIKKNTEKELLRLKNTTGMSDLTGCDSGVRQTENSLARQDTQQSLVWRPVNN